MRFREKAPAPGKHEWTDPLNVGEGFYLLAHGSYCGISLDNDDDDDLQPPARVVRLCRVLSRQTSVALSRDAASVNHLRQAYLPLNH